MALSSLTLIVAHVIACRLVYARLTYAFVTFRNTLDRLSSQRSSAVHRHQQVASYSIYYGLPAATVANTVYSHW